MPEVLQGLIERVTYHNPENGFAVLKVQVKGRRDLVTVVGSTTSVSTGEHLEAITSPTLGRGLAPEPLGSRIVQPIRDRTMPKFVQFIGGPLDGHLQDISERKQPLPTVLHLEISRNTYRLLANQSMQPDEPRTSRATYELSTGNYRFVAARIPAQKPTAGR